MVNVSPDTALTTAAGQCASHAVTRESYCSAFYRCTCVQHTSAQGCGPARAHEQEFRYSQNPCITVKRALRVGLIARGSACEDCGKQDTGDRYLRRDLHDPHVTRSLLVAHHDDYNFPLRVRWLCRSCHGKWHGKNEPIRRPINWGFE